MKDNYTCIIVDDEPIAIEMLMRKIETLYNNISILNTYTDWSSALDALRNLKFDILFIDISMPEKNGMSLLKLVPELKSEIIFVTAHSDYALSAFSFSPTGYVLKPINDLQFTKAVNKAIEHTNYKRTSDVNVSRNTLHSGIIAIPNNKGQDYIHMRDVIFIEAIEGYTKVVTINTKILSSFNLGKFYEIVQSFNFFQVHRSYIINLSYIKRYRTEGIIVMQDGTEIPVARGRRDDFLKIFYSVAKPGNVPL